MEIIIISIIKKILPFGKNETLNSSIFYSITSSFFKKIKYEKSVKYFFIFI